MFLYCRSAEYECFNNSKIEFDLERLAKLCSAPTPIVENENETEEKTNTQTSQSIAGNEFEMVEHDQKVQNNRICNQCHRTFARATNLREHLLTHDENRTAFHCSHPNCDQSYGFKKNWRVHFKKHHSDVISEMQEFEAKMKKY